MAKTNSRTVAKIHRMVDEFLKARITVDGGSWPEVSDGDMGALWELFSAIVDAKFERDGDGDSVINFYVVDRKRYMPLLFFRPVQYLHEAKTLADLFDIIRTRQDEMRYAAEQADRALRYLEGAHASAAKLGITPDEFLTRRHE